MCDGDGDTCDKCADVPVISDTPSSRRVEEGGGRGDGMCLINMGEISSANKGNVRFLIRPTCLKARPRVFGGLRFTISAR